MRKLFISMSLKHAPECGLRWHIQRVKFMEEMWETFCAHARVSKI